MKSLYTYISKLVMWLFLSQFNSKNINRASTGIAWREIIPQKERYEYSLLLHSTKQLDPEGMFGRGWPEAKGSDFQREEHPFSTAATDVETRWVSQVATCGIMAIPYQSEGWERTMGKFPKTCSRATWATNSQWGHEGSRVGNEEEVLGRVFELWLLYSSPPAKWPRYRGESSTCVKSGERGREHVSLSLGPDSPLWPWVTFCKVG